MPVLAVVIIILINLFYHYHPLLTYLDGKLLKARHDSVYVCLPSIKAFCSVFSSLIKTSSAGEAEPEREGWGIFSSLDCFPQARSLELPIISKPHSGL